jgi:DNA-binding transcriptional MerR regulator
MYTVKDLTRLAGITPRTLHYYDEIGLLKPSQVGDNGYRYYGEEALLRLQQILLYRQLELPLEEIKKIMGRRDFDILSALEAHKQAIQKKRDQLQEVENTVDKTIEYLKGKLKMDNQQLFKGLSKEQEEAYAKEAEERYDPEIVRASNKRWQGYSEEKKAQILQESGKIYVEMAAVMPQGPESAEAQACVERWRKNMDFFWTPNLDQLVGLSELYNQDERFKANFDRINKDLAEFFRAAVKIYVANEKKK